MHRTNGYSAATGRGHYANQPLWRAHVLEDYPIELPPATGGDEVSAAAIGALADLYQLSELEQAGIIPAAEAIVDARSTLPLPSEHLAEVLDQFAHAAANWYDRQAREQLFARLFGTGSGAAAVSDGTVNHDFEQRLAGLCAAVNRLAVDQTPGAASPAGDLAQIAEAASGLIANLSLRQYGNTGFAAHRLRDQLQAATVILKDHDVQTLSGTRSFWQTVERILSPNVPDIARLLERGAAGRVILLSLPRIAVPAALLAEPATTELMRAAASWLAATGLDPSSAASPGGRT